MTVVRAEADGRARKPQGGGSLGHDNVRGSGEKAAAGAGMASASFCRGKGVGDAPTMAQDVGEEAVAACGLTGAAVAEGGRRRRQVGPGGQRLGTGHRRAAMAGARVGRRGLLGRAKRAAGPAVGGERGKLGCGAGPKTEKGEEK